MEKHYYIGEGSQAEELIAETLERENVAREARKTLMAEYEADGLVLSVWDHGKVAGLAFDKPTSRPYLKRETELSNGKGYGYYPKLNTKEEKRLSTLQITFCALSMALAMVLSFVKFFSLPFGGTTGEITLWPHRHQTDGFYLCKLRRHDD